VYPALSGSPRQERSQQQGKHWPLKTTRQSSGSGPPGSGSVIICTDPDPSMNQGNNWKNLGFNCVVSDFLMTGYL
jgi:hypothetical protein